MPLKVREFKNRNENYGDFEFLSSVNELIDYRIKLVTLENDEPESWIEIQSRGRIFWKTIGECFENDEEYDIRIDRRHFHILSPVLEELFKYRKANVYLR